MRGGEDPSIWVMSVLNTDVQGKASGVLIPITSAAALFPVHFPPPPHSLGISHTLCGSLGKGNVEGPDSWQRLALSPGLTPLLVFRSPSRRDPERRKSTFRGTS